MRETEGKERQRRRGREGVQGEAEPVEDWHRSGREEEERELRVQDGGRRDS